MKESIHIQNFGPLRDVRIDDIKPLTVLIGDSASGKSALMKVVALMRYIYKMVNVRAYLKNAGLSKSPFRLRFDSLLYDGIKEMFGPETEVEYTVHMLSGRTYTIACKNGMKANISVENEDLVFFKGSFVTETRSVVPMWYARGASIRGDLGFFFHETFNDFFQAVDQITEQPLGYIRMKMLVKQVGMRKELFVVPNDRRHAPVKLHHASSGVQTSAPLMTIVHYFANGFSFTSAFRRSVLSYLLNGDMLSQFRPEVNLQDLKKYVHLYIEEPELSLDPKTQCLFINDLIREAFYRGDNKRPDDGRQLGLMFATHSPYILNHLNVLLKASYYEKARESYPYINPDEIAVYQLHDGEVHSLVEDDEETGERIIDTYKFSETMEWILDKYESVD